MDHADTPRATAAKPQRRPGRPRKARPQPKPPPAPILLPPRLLALPAVALYLSLSIWSVRDLVKSKRLSPVPIPSVNGKPLRKLVFDREDLDRLIQVWKGRP